jgi:glycosyltransferase involved in cell wall biosynthesis
MAAHPPVSVVIATLGGDCLAQTLETLNRGSIVPDEILVCIPRDNVSNVARLSLPNLRIVATECRGQVAQRAVGFARAANDYVLQLDDDMLVDEQCLERLVAAVGDGREPIAASASLICVSNGQSFYRRPSNRAALGLYYWILNGARGYQPGGITRAGTNVGVDPQGLQQDCVEAEWLPGGCVMHRRANLVLDDFYPFKGKAYSEDLFHSQRLRAKGVRLVVSTSARCLIDDTPVFPRMSPGVFLRFVRADLRARKHLVRTSGLSVARMYLYYLIALARYAVQRITA